MVSIMRVLSALLLSLAVPCGALAQTVDGLQADAAAMLDLVEHNYAYPERVPEGWADHHAGLRNAIGQIKSRRDLLGFAETALHRLCDHHAITGPSSTDSAALVPSFADLWVEEADGSFRITQVRRASPAAAAGFMPGDRFVSVDGAEIESFADVQRIVSGRAGDEIVFVMMRDGEEVTLVATPALTERTDALGNIVRIGVIGVVNNEEMGQPRLITYSPGQAVLEGISETGHIIARTGQFLQRFVTGREDRCQLGGPVKIAEMSGKAAALGFEWLVQLVALLSVGIGFLNLLPIPPLDGGHLVFYAVEAVIRRPVPERVMEGIYRVGLLLVLVFMAFVFWNDIFGC